MRNAVTARFSAVLLSVAAIFPVAAGDSPCDRACLKNALDQYLQAVTTHDPTGAPLAVGFRQTDNAVAVLPGTGIWKTVTALGNVQRRFFDTVSGQAAYFGTVQEGDNAAIAVVRVKVEATRITEAEWIIARKGTVGLNGNAALLDPGNLAATPPPDRTARRENGLARQDLIGITNSYFDGITAHDGTIILAQPGCLRVENGVTVTGRALQAGQVQANRWQTTDCTSNLANINIQNVAARRYPVVDEDAGVVVAMAVFLRKPGSPQRRNVFSELFFIEGRKIRSIYSAMFYPAPEAPVPNWPPYDGNWPLPATFGGTQ
jgi:hypothetical protein